MKLWPCLPKGPLMDPCEVMDLPAIRLLTCVVVCRHRPKHVIVHLFVHCWAQTCAHAIGLNHSQPISSHAAQVHNTATLEAQSSNSNLLDHGSAIATLQDRRPSRVHRAFVLVFAWAGLRDMRICVQLQCIHTNHQAILTSVKALFAYVE